MRKWLARDEYSTNTIFQLMNTDFTTTNDTIHPIQFSRNLDTSRTTLCELLRFFSY